MNNKEFLSKEKIIALSNGDVMHALKNNSEGFNGFGEAYFSKVNYNSIKAWKKHKKMNLNLLVPHGKVCFVVLNQEKGKDIFNKYILSSENYYRLTIPEGICFGFKGLFNPYSIVLNISDIIHSEEEVKKIDVNEIKYNWEDIL